MFCRKQDHVILSEAKNPSYAGKKDGYVGKKENLALFPVTLNLIVASEGFFTPLCFVQNDMEYAIIVLC
jgi:hypothetical protein